MAETSSKEEGAEGEPVTPKKKDDVKLSYAEEREKDSKKRTVVDDAAYAAEEDKKEPDAAATDEPPAKTTPLRRPLLRPRPNISTERKTAETPPLPP
ncbi:hypothetical protein MTO96_028587 [Rhipicephalus appendiculatus]